MSKLKEYQSISETGGDFRNRVIEAAKQHKASWIALGQYLYSVYKEKMYKDWGFLAFETYCEKELGIKSSTAGKLLRSYYFLEKEEPSYVQAEYRDEAKPNTVPDYNSVNLLRLAKQNKEIRPSDYAQIRKAVLDQCREPKEIRQEIKKAVTPIEEKDSVELRRERRNAAIKRLMSWLERTKKELQSERLLPDYLLRQMEDLRSKLEDQME